MQDNIQQPVTAGESEEFKEFKRQKHLEEAKANLLKIECDCLSPAHDKNRLKEVCKEADTLKIGAVVVFPAYVKTCVSFLGKDPSVSLIAAVDYPYGSETTDVKTAAVKRAVKDGVDEVEVCAPLSILNDGGWTYFKKECKKLKKAAKVRALRITLDCGVLTEKVLLKAASVAADTGVNCLRLNNADGETVAKVKEAVKGKCLLKADRAENAVAFANFCTMGADTIGCASPLELAKFILKQAENE